MKVYGAQICIDCRNYKLVQNLRGFAAEYIDITESTDNLKEFLAIRDLDPVFEAVREKHTIGIPLFVREDGAKTLDLSEALAWLGEAPLQLDELLQMESPCGENGCS